METAKVCDRTEVAHYSFIERRTYPKIDEWARCGVMICVPRSTPYRTLKGDMVIDFLAHWMVAGRVDHGLRPLQKLLMQIINEDPMHRTIRIGEDWQAFDERADVTLSLRKLYGTYCGAM